MAAVDAFRPVSGAADAPALPFGSADGAATVSRSPRPRRFFPLGRTPRRRTIGPTYAPERKAAMHTLCPPCRTPIELVRLKPHEEIACPSCGSSFHLEAESTTAYSPQAGQKVGRFEVLQSVGQGAFGTVYK